MAMCKLSHFGLFFVCLGFKPLANSLKILVGSLTILNLSTESNGSTVKNKTL